MTLAIHGKNLIVLFGALQIRPCLRPDGKRLFRLCCSCRVLEMLAFYISSNTLSSVPWAIPFGKEQIQVMVNQAKDVLCWYNNMKKLVPTWYKGII